MSLYYENIVEDDKSICSKIFWRNGLDKLNIIDYNGVYCEIWDEVFLFTDYTVIEDDLSSVYIFKLTPKVFAMHYRWPKEETEKLLIVEILKTPVNITSFL